MSESNVHMYVQVELLPLFHFHSHFFTTKLPLLNLIKVVTLQALGVGWALVGVACTMAVIFGTRRGKFQIFSIWANISVLPLRNLSFYRHKELLDEKELA